MSGNYDAALAALSSNEGLRNKVMSSTSAEERAGHLRDAGLDVVNRRYRDLADVTGAGGTATLAAAPAIVAGASAA